MKHVRFLLIAMMAVCFSVVANAQVSKTKTAQKAVAIYQCPMKCEGDKAYTLAGDCPVCGMHLKAAAKSASYQCPMKCEGVKTYAKEGKCPVCNMKLTLITKKNDKKDHINHANKHS